MIKVKYIVNNREVDEAYFYFLGEFTPEEFNTIEIGETVTKEGNVFWKTVVEE